LIRKDRLVNFKNKEGQRKPETTEIKINSTVPTDNRQSKMAAPAPLPRPADGIYLVWLIYTYTAFTNIKIN
jgi:hypothetical protein